MWIHGERRSSLIAVVYLMWTALVLASLAPTVDGADPIPGSAPNPEGRDSSEVVLSAPKLAVDRTEHDFGLIRPGSMNAAVFRLTNAGAGTLRITNVQKCCGTVTELRKAALAPNESTVLRVEYRAPRGPGTFNKKIVVETDDGTRARVELTITGEIVPTVVWTPSQFNIAAYDRDVTCPRIILESLDGRPFAIRAFAATGNCLTAAFDPNCRATKFTLTPTVDLVKLDGLKTSSGAIRIDLDHPDHKAITIVFRLMPLLQAVPAQIIVFNADRVESAIRSLRIQDNQTGGSAAIASVAAKNGTRVELRSTTPNHTGCDVQMEIWPVSSVEDGPFVNDELVVRLEDGRELRVPLRVFY